MNNLNVLKTYILSRPSIILYCLFITVLLWVKCDQIDFRLLCDERIKLGRVSLTLWQPLQQLLSWQVKRSAMENSSFIFWYSCLWIAKQKGRNEDLLLMCTQSVLQPWQALPARVKVSDMFFTAIYNFCLMCWLMYVSFIDFFVFQCTRTVSHLCLCMMALKSFPSLQLVVKLSQRRPWYPSTILWDQSNSFSLAVMSSDWPFTWMSEIWERRRCSESAISAANWVLDGNFWEAGAHFFWRSLGW